jgi:hypothetical protein
LIIEILFRLQQTLQGQVQRAKRVERAREHVMALFLPKTLFGTKWRTTMKSLSFQQICPDHAALKPVRYNTTREDLNQINEGEKKNGKGMRTEEYDGTFRPVQFRGACL